MTWVAWVAALAVLAGAGAGSYLAGREEWELRLGHRIGLAVSAGVGAAVVAALVAIPARAAVLPQTATSAPASAALAALLGVLIGVLAAVLTQTVRLAAVSIVLLIGVVWLLALISVAPSLPAGSSLPEVRLAVLDLFDAPPVAVLCAPLLALLICGGISFAARTRGLPPLQTAVATAAAPGLLALIYLVGTPGTGDRDGQTTPYAGALIALAVGLLTSLLIGIVRHRVAATCRPDRWRRRSPPRPARTRARRHRHPPGPGIGDAGQTLPSSAADSGVEFPPADRPAGFDSGLTSSFAPVRSPGFDAGLPATGTGAGLPLTGSGSPLTGSGLPLTGSGLTGTGLTGSGLPAAGTGPGSGLGSTPAPASTGFDPTLGPSRPGFDLAPGFGSTAEPRAGPRPAAPTRPPAPVGRPTRSRSAPGRGSPGSTAPCRVAEGSVHRPAERSAHRPADRSRPPGHPDPDRPVAGLRPPRHRIRHRYAGRPAGGARDGHPVLFDRPTDRRPVPHPPGPPPAPPIRWRARSGRRRNLHPVRPTHDKPGPVLVRLLVGGPPGTRPLGRDPRPPSRGRRPPGRSPGPPPVDRPSPASTCPRPASATAVPDSPRPDQPAELVPATTGPIGGPLASETAWSTVSGQASRPPVRSPGRPGWTS